MKKRGEYVVIRHQISGIKCDAEGCDYYDRTATPDRYVYYLNKPCPKCGANLLTKEDYIGALRIMEGARRLNKIANRLLPEWLLKLLDVDMNKPTRFRGERVANSEVCWKKDEGR
jgi:hypothetical protein